MAKVWTELGVDFGFAAGSIWGDPLYLVATRTLSHEPCPNLRSVLLVDTRGARWKMAARWKGEVYVWTSIQGCVKGVGWSYAAG